MVFGANSNGTHWKKIFEGYHQSARGLFLQYLKENSNITAADFQKYWTSMTAFRNEYVAHKANYAEPVPNFDKACVIAFCFDDWIRIQIKPDSIPFPSFKELFYEYQKDINNTLQTIIKGR